MCSHDRQGREYLVPGVVIRRCPVDSTRFGVVLVRQEPMLVPSFDVTFTTEQLPPKECPSGLTGDEQLATTAAISSNSVCFSIVHTPHREGCRGRAEKQAHRVERRPSAHSCEVANRLTAQDRLTDTG